MTKKLTYWQLLFSTLVPICLTAFSSQTPNELNTPVPTFHLPTIASQSATFTSQDLHGHVSILTIWASWCNPCRKQHPLLLTIQAQHIPLYGINYKDSLDSATEWLQTLGNPFIKIGFDQSGFVGDKLGIYGTPETFLIDKHGIIRYDHIGLLTQSEWKNILWPLVKKYQNER